MRAWFGIFVLPLLVCAAACDKGSGSGASGSANPSSKASAAQGKPAATLAAAKPPGGPRTCKDYSTEGEGSFSEPCKLKGPAPFAVKWTGKYMEDFGEKKPEFEFTSNFDHETSWGNVSVWYYDKDGKVLEHKSKDGSTFKRYYKNGSGVLPLKPHESKKLAFGMAEKETPKGTVAIEAEVTGFGWDDEPKLYLDAYSEKDDLDARPKGGWK